MVISAELAQKKKPKETIKTTEKTTLEEMEAVIKQMRDEIAVKAHPGKAETAEELEKLDKK